MISVIALYDYQPEEDSQLAFLAGDEIMVIHKDPSGWWDGELNEKRGWYDAIFVNYRFPSNFVKEKKSPLKADTSIRNNEVDLNVKVTPISLSSVDLTDDLHSLKINSSTPNKVTPTFTWMQVNEASPLIENDITKLTKEISADLDNKKFELLSKKANNLISIMKNLLSELKDDKIHEQKGWISALLLSLTKIIKNSNPKNMSIEQMDEIKLLLKGLSEAASDLFQFISDGEKHLTVPSDSIPKRNIKARDAEAKYPSPLSDSTVPNVLSIKTDSAKLLFDPNGKVRAGDINSLLMYLIDRERSDFSFTNAFLITYKLYFSSMDLFSFLKGLLSHNNVEINCLDKDTIMPNSKLQDLLMVVSITRSWIENYLLLDSDDSHMIEPLMDMSDNFVEKILPGCGEQLFRILDRKIKNLKNAPVQLDCPSPILPKNLNRMRFLELDTLELARQLSLLYYDRFSKINAHEILPSDLKRNHILESAFSISKKVSSWVSLTILLEKNTEKRALLLNHFILLGEQCLLLNNFQGVSDIVRGLRSNSVNRLAKTWRQIPSKIYKLLRYLHIMVSSDNNYSEYRGMMQKINETPYIPLLHCHLGDLRLIHSNYPTFTESGMVNFRKMTLLTDSIDNLIGTRKYKYALVYVPAFHMYFNQCFADDADENTKHKMSYSLEPAAKQANILADKGTLNSLKQLGMI